MIADITTAAVICLLLLGPAPTRPRRIVTVSYFWSCFSSGRRLLSIAQIIHGPPFPSLGLVCCSCCALSLKFFVNVEVEVKPTFATALLGEQEELVHLILDLVASIDLCGA
jgi:hypothetical protein